MAKVVFSGLLEGSYLEDPYFVGNLSLEVVSGEKAIIHNEGPGTRIVLRGNNLAGNDDFTSGRIDKISFDYPGHGTFVKVTDADVKAKGLIESAQAGEGTFGMLRVMFDANDTFIGSDEDDKLFAFGGKDKLDGGKGNDYLNGQAGNDSLTGGKGSDSFLFAKSYGHDIITDFDAKGGGDAQDHLYIKPNQLYDFTLKTNGDGDAMLLFDNGATLTLEGVNKSQIGEADFILFG